MPRTPGVVEVPLALPGVAEAVRALRIGEATQFGRFIVRRVRRHDYVLRDVDVSERTRWGDYEGIIEDVTYALAYDVLPPPSGERW